MAGSDWLGGYLNSPGAEVGRSTLRYDKRREEDTAVRPSPGLVPEDGYVWV